MCLCVVLLDAHSVKIMFVFERLRRRIMGNNGCLVERCIISCALGGFLFRFLIVPSPTSVCSISSSLFLSLFHVSHLIRSTNAQMLPNATGAHKAVIIMHPQSNNCIHVKQSYGTFCRTNGGKIHSLLCTEMSFSFCLSMHVWQY